MRNLSTFLEMALASAVLIGAAVERSAQPTAPAAAPNLVEPPAYHFLMSDFMASVIQPRHIKLWLGAMQYGRAAVPPAARPSWYGGTAHPPATGRAGTSRSPARPSTA